MKRDIPIRMSAFLSILLILGVACRLSADPRRTPCEFRVTSHEIEARLYPDEHRLEAVDRVSLEKEGRRCRSWNFRLGSGLEVNEVRMGGRSIPFRRMSERGVEEIPDTIEGHEGKTGPVEWEVDLEDLGGQGENLVVEVTYGGIIYDSLKVPSFSREFIADQTTGLIGDEGTYLAEESGWYPKASDGLVSFALEVTLPAAFEAVSQGKREVDEVEGDIRLVRWISSKPTDLIYLIAGRYEVEEREADGIPIYAYFFPESRDLRENYLTATARYIRMYTEQIGPYPYEKFAVVENFFESGYGMPSFTLLGSQVIRLPFIVHTSLGHEVLHNWWGNSVFVDSSSGNWCESLTTYMADYHYKELESEEAARSYRLEINKAYSNYVHTGDDFSLAAFTSRTTPATRSVGYGKGAMIYHGLRRILGDEAFYGALRVFYRDHVYDWASWEDLKRAFEEAGRIDLDWYFDQWIEGVGAPLLRLNDVSYRSGTPGSVDFAISQEGTGAPYRLDVPVVVETKEGAEGYVVELRKTQTHYSLPVSGAPTRLSVDPDHHLFRRMDSLEIPPSLSMVLGDENEMIVLPDRAGEEALETYRSLVEQINRTGKAKVKTAGEMTSDDTATHSLFILGKPQENSAWAALMNGRMEDFSVAGDSVTVSGTTYPSAGHSFLSVFRNLQDPGRGIALFFGGDTSSILESGRKLVHYGQYGYLVFEGGKNVAKGSWEVKDSPLVNRFE